MVSKPKGLQGQYAGFVTRAIAFVADILIIIAIMAVVNGAIAVTLQFFMGVDVSSCPPLSSIDQILSGGMLCHAANWVRLFLTALLAPGYFALFWSLGGQTLGQYAMGLRVVRLDGKRMTFLRSIARWIGYLLSFFALGIGYLWILWDDRRQGFADKLAKTVVVYAWEARQNEFLLDRIRQRLRPRRRATAAATTQLVAGTKPIRLEVVLTTFPTMPKVREVMNVLQSAIRAGACEIVTSSVLVKDETGAIGYVGSSDLAAGDETARSAALLASDPRLKQINTEQLTANLPNSSFILLIIVEDKNLTTLLKTLSGAKAAAQVFDLDTPAHAPMTVTPAHPEPVPFAASDTLGELGGPQAAPVTATAAASLSSVLAGDN
jgi:uncharacterized RDD family membrane protein YckC